MLLCVSYNFILDNYIIAINSIIFLFAHITLIPYLCRSNTNEYFSNRYDATQYRTTRHRKETLC